MERCDWAYLAGLIDGDGCFYLQLKPDHHGHNVGVIPQLIVTSGEKEKWLLEELREKFGGSVKKHSKQFLI